MNKITFTNNHVVKTYIKEAHFQNELVVLGKLKNSKYIVQMYNDNTNKDTFDGRYQIKLKRYKIDLCDYLLKYKYDISSKIRYYFIHHLCEAISFIHSKYIFHNDIKLENILLDDDNKIHLCDFETASYYKTNSNEFKKFTTYYTPPFNNKDKSLKNKDNADIYAFGVCIHLILTNRFPLDKKYTGYLQFCMSENTIFKKIDFAYITVVHLLLNIYLKKNIFDIKEMIQHLHSDS